ncbi:MAG TPA: NAD-dependent epimerase/dehydratase family protein [Chloroflexaceae bacterium]|nr:NAD-dependent epimerase/dehydratase family protein [Chloroflexaceae bacterium]
MTRVLINGIDGLLGARVAELLSAEPDVTVLGLAEGTPPAPIGRAEYLVARLGGRQLLELLRAEGVEVVVHLAFAGAERPARSREEAVQQNVLGSMELLGACAAAGVRRVLLRSHTRVYGASPLNPTFIREDRPVARSTAPGVLRDYVEVEQFVAEFAARHPDMAVVPVRCAPLLGGWSPFVNYLSQPGPRMLVGFDPCVQALHVEDAAAGFALAALTEIDGPVNLAADDTLCLSQAIKLAGRQPVALLEPMVSLAFTMGNSAILGTWPYDVSFLRHSCIADTCRARAELGWAPARTVAESLGAIGANGRAAVSREMSEEALRAFLARRS